MIQHLGLAAGPVFSERITLLRIPEKDQGMLARMRQMAAGMASHSAAQTPSVLLLLCGVQRLQTHLYIFLKLEFRNRNILH